ncbi:globin domain-containing protein [Roseobacter sp. MH60115]|uniref:globin domain-containing protein n=1 Tax=Roseobacter sp. MH60115 TaxID=2785324 RepID=UPI0018A260D7|nr:globin domain-containing protein [Roseobacter sp. MH60115]
MTEDDVALVQESWAQVVPIADAAMKQFYCRLFDADAGLAKPFADTDMASQRSHLASAINLVVGNLHQPETLVRPLQDLGARHASYRVAERDFDLVGEALLATLASGLADHWTEAHLNAWAAAWQAILSHVLVGFQTQRAA